MLAGNMSLCGRDKSTYVLEAWKERKKEQGVRKRQGTS